MIARDDLATAKHWLFNSPRVHWMRNALGYVSKTQQSMVAAALRQAFLQADRAQASETLRRVADQLRQKWPKLAAFIDESEIDVLSYLDFTPSADTDPRRISCAA